jgi:hypothetical protein
MKPVEKLQIDLKAALSSEKHEHTVFFEQHQILLTLEIFVTKNTVDQVDENQSTLASSMTSQTELTRRRDNNNPATTIIKRAKKKNNKNA